MNIWMKMCVIEIVGKWWVRSVEVLDIYMGKIIIKKCSKKCSKCMIRLLHVENVVNVWLDPCM